MATLTGQSIASSYEQLLHVDTDGGGNTTTLVPIKDGDNGTTFCLQLSTTKAMIEGNGSTLYFYDEGGESISADNAGVLSIAAGAEIDLTATAVDINGAVDISSTLAVNGTTTLKAGTSASVLDLYNTNTSANTAELDSTSSDGAVFRLKQGGTTKVEFTSHDTSVSYINTGNVGIGTVAPDRLLHLSKSATPEFAISSSGNSSDIKNVQLQVDSSGDLNIHMVNDAWDAIQHTLSFQRNGDVISAGDLIFGTAGKGICLGVTSNTDANTLDDYEEGTWTPNLTPGTSGSIGEGTAQGTYTKIGRMVHVQCYIATNAASSPVGRLQCSGFPFTFGSSQGIAVSNVYNSGLASDPGGHLIVRYDSATTALIDIQESDGTDPAVDASNHIDASTELSFSLAYNT